MRFFSLIGNPQFLHLQFLNDAIVEYQTLLYNNQVFNFNILLWEIFSICVIKIFALFLKRGKLLG